LKAIWQNDELQSTYKKCLSDLIFWTHGRIDLLHAFQLPFLKSLTDAEWFSFPFARWERQLRAYGRQPGRPKLHTGDWRAVPLKGEDQAKLSERRLRGLVPFALELSELVDAELVDAELVLAAFEGLHATPHIGPHFVKLATLSLDAARPSLKLAADNCSWGARARLRYATPRGHLATARHAACAGEHCVKPLNAVEHRYAAPTQERCPPCPWQRRG